MTMRKLITVALLLALLCTASIYAKEHLIRRHQLGAFAWENPIAESGGSGRDELGNGSSYRENASKQTNASKPPNNTLKATKSPNVRKATKSSKSPKGSKSSKGYHLGPPANSMYPSSYVRSSTTYECSCLFSSD
jgi:hypothetical protein|mmetsp:Transcript_9712/g.17679  ORF Transcript_9712/g.17679 Transcript_9712/m.17679 type:complete len:135 (+) Transcript_9712:220-624(+)